MFDWKKAVLFILFSIPITFFFSLLNHYLNLGISDDDIDNFLQLLILFLSLLITIPQLQKDFRKHFIKVKSLDKIIALPILFAILELLLVYIYYYFPVLFGGETISLGKDQYTGHPELSLAGDILLAGVFGPFNEEFVYRFLLIFYIPYVFLYSFVKESSVSINYKNKKIGFLERQANKVYHQAFIIKNKKLIASWVIVCSFLFAMAHGPDASSFALYFVPGLLFSYLYLKYGFLASWICHGASNILSSYINSIFYSLFN